MSNVSKISDGRTTDELASEWVAPLAAGDASPEDRARLRAWLREHPSHQAAFDDVSSTWQRISAMGESVRHKYTADHGPKVVAQYTSRSDSSSIRRSEQRSARVSKGQRIEYDQRVGNVAELPAKAIDRDLAWRQGLLIFDNQSLDEVIREIERYTDMRLIIADDELHRRRVGGAFRAGDVEAVLEFFEKLKIDVDRDGPNNTVYLTASASHGRK